MQICTATQKLFTNSVYHISTKRGRRFLGLMPKFVVLQFLHSFTNMTPLDGENGITEVLRIVLD